MLVDESLFGCSTSKVKKNIGLSFDKPEYDNPTFETPVVYHKYLYEDGYLRFLFSDDELMQIQFFEFKSFDNNIYYEAVALFDVPIIEDMQSAIFEVSKNVSFHLFEYENYKGTVFVQVYEYEN